MTFLTLALAGQATGLVLRAGGHVWASRPAPILIVAIAAAAAVGTIFAWMGWLMAALPVWLIASLYVGGLACAPALDATKIVMLRRPTIDRRRA